jgi:tRNA-intron endonuclease
VKKKTKIIHPTVKKKKIKDATGASTRTIFSGTLVGDKIIVDEDYERALEYYNKGSFGELHGVKKCRLELSLHEALYLLERARIHIQYGRKKDISFEEFVRVASRVSKGFWTRYRVYRELRTRGYILKTALKFGADFLVYARGVKPGQSHSKWVLFCADENGSISWRGFSAMNRVAHSTRKNLMVGIVDERGAVTYYEIRWIKP